MKPKIFRSKKAALEAVEDCQCNGWKAGLMGSGPYQVQAIHSSNGQRIVYDLHTDGHMREYSRKEVAA